VRRLAQDAGVRASQLTALPGEPGLAEATGSAPTTGEPITERDYAALIAPPRNERNNRRGGRQGRGPRRERGPWQGRDGRNGGPDSGRRNGRSGGRDGGWNAGRSGGEEQRRAAYHSGR
jgi:hypothetical protein